MLRAKIDIFFFKKKNTVMIKCIGSLPILWENVMWVPARAKNVAREACCLHLPLKSVDLLQVCQPEDLTKVKTTVEEHHLADLG